MRGTVWGVGVLKGMSGAAAVMGPGQGPRQGLCRGGICRPGAGIAESRQTAQGMGAAPHPPQPGFGSTSLTRPEVHADRTTQSRQDECWSGKETRDSVLGPQLSSGAHSHPDGAPPPSGEITSETSLGAPGADLSPRGCPVMPPARVEMCVPSLAVKGSGQGPPRSFPPARLQLVLEARVQGRGSGRGEGGPPARPGKPHRWPLARNPLNLTQGRNRPHASKPPGWQSWSSWVSGVTWSLANTVSARQ